MARKSISKLEPMLKDEDVFGNTLSIDDALKQELEDKGLVARWLSSNILHSNQGYHPKGWSVYRRESKDPRVDVLFGNDPDGVVRRGDCILGVKPKDMVEKHRKLLKQKADRAIGAHKRQAEELRQMASQSNGNVRVEEGFDDE